MKYDTVVDALSRNTVEKVWASEMNLKIKQLAVELQLLKWGVDVLHLMGVKAETIVIHAGL